MLLTGETSYYVELPAGAGDPGHVHPTDMLEAKQILADGDLLAALPPIMRRGLACLSLKGAVELRTQLVVDQKDTSKMPVVWWDGNVQLPSNSFNAGLDVTGVSGGVWCRGLFDGQEQQLKGLVGTMLFRQVALLGQPISQVQCQVVVPSDKPMVLCFRNLKSQMFGGLVGAEGRVDFGAPKLAYELDLKGMQIQLDQFGKHNLGASSNMQGEAMVQMYLSGNGTELTDLKGNGVVNVPNGKLYRLPVLLDLLKFIGLRAPDGTAFEAAKMLFQIDNGQLIVQKLDLIGNAISLRGQGTVNLDNNNLMLDFHSDWGRIHQVLPPWLNVIPQTIGDQLLKITVRGKISDPKFDKEFVPPVSETARQFFGGSGNH